MSARRDVVHNARQFGRIGLALLVVSVVVGIAASAPIMWVFVIVGLAMYAGSQYLIGRYGDD